uniref:Endo/exonuclease/phosphatase domain-containing protein n=1 Tax=Haemonchus contortus TaxID=6289 RepID=A0A7I5EAV9_HAECO
MAVCTFNARTLASEACIEDLVMQARKIKYDVIGLTEMRRHRPLHAVFETGEELFLGTCDSRGVGRETEAVIKALGNQGVPSQYIRMLRELYDKFTTRISPFY